MRRGTRARHTPVIRFVNRVEFTTLAKWILNFRILQLYLQVLGLGLEARFRVWVRVTIDLSI